MPIVPAGSTNLTGIGVPNVYVQIIPPNPLLNGVPTDIVGVVGSATWGPVNAPTVIGSMEQYVSQFGSPANRKYDMGIGVYAASLQGANNFLCARVTDGTDTASSIIIQDVTTAAGATLTSLYSGSLGNNIFANISNGSGSTIANPTYKLVIYFSGGVPEVFDNIGGTGAAFWTNLVNAVNLGQNGLRGPSQICVASTGSIISSVTVLTAGSYATLPTLGSTGSGSGAVLNATMKAVSAVPVVAGSGYVPTDTITLTGGVHTINSILTVSTTKLVSVAVNAGGSNYLVGDTITLAGGTFSTATILTVATVNSGAITGVTITNAGSYTANTSSFTQGSTSGVGTGATFNTALFGVNTAAVTTAGAYTTLPSSPVSQGSTSGSGAGATFTVLWGLLSVQVASAGSGYTTSSGFSVTGGSGSGATGTLVLGSMSAPNLNSPPNPYQLSGGTDGATNVTSTTLIGNDAATPKTGMYSLRSTNASIVMLSDEDDSTKWTLQSAFGLQEGMYMIGITPLGQQDNITGSGSAIALLQASGVTSYSFKLMNGDWIYLFDPFNNVTRLVSPQGFTCGILAGQLPSGSSLNKIMSGIIDTEKTFEKRFYSDADLQTLVTGGVDVITRPIPASQSAFGVRLGVNTSGNVVTKFDNYPRMINFLSRTFNNGLGIFIGLPQTPDIQNQARSTLETFLSNIQQLGLIGTLDGSPAFSVILDSSNNPQNRVVIGFMQADVQVVLFSIIQQFVVNLQAGGNIQIQVLPPQVLKR